MSITRVGLLRRFIRETLEADDVEGDEDVSTLEPGDRIDVMGGEVDYSGVRILRFVDDVRTETGMSAGDDDMHLGGNFSGPGFVGKTDEGDELVFSLDQVVPGSKAKYYFPDDQVDAYGRDVPNPYRRMAYRNSLAHIEKG